MKSELVKEILAAYRAELRAAGVTAQSVQAQMAAQGRAVSQQKGGRASEALREAVRIGTGV